MRHLGMCAVLLRNYANCMLRGHFGYTRLYSDMQMESCCDTMPSKMHFMAPCVPTASCADHECMMVTEHAHGSEGSKAYS